MAAKQLFFKRHPKKVLIGFVVLVLISIDVILANVYRQITGYSFYENLRAANHSEKTFRVFSPIYHHDLKPLVFHPKSTWGPMSYAVSTDSLGFKNRAKINIEKTSERSRILFIGDSFVEGVGIHYEETFVGLVAGRLAKQGIEVLNGAVVSYSPTIYWRKVKHLLESVELRFTDLIVFIDISDIYDEVSRYEISGDLTVVDADAETRLIKTIKKHSVMIPALRLFYLRFSLGSWQLGNPQKFTRQYGINSSKALWTVKPHLMEQFGTKGLAKSAVYMDKLSELAKVHGIHLQIAVYPWPDQIFHNDLDSIQVRFWKDWAKRNNISIINFFPCFIRSGEDISLRYQTIEKYFIQGDVHWNANGHELIAKNLPLPTTSRGSRVGQSCAEYTL